MSDHAPTTTTAADHHDDPMSHVPPPSIWPLLVTVALCIIPFATLITVSKSFVLTTSNIRLGDASWQVPPGWGWPMLMVGGFILLFTLMGWASQIIREKILSHDLRQQQADLKQFIACFLVSELAVFGAIFAYFYHRKIWFDGFGPPPGAHIGGPMAAYATFMLISSSATCEFAHRALEHGRRGMAKALLVSTLVLGAIFLSFQGKEWGELIARGFTPGGLGNDSPYSSFAGLFYTATGFHGLHVAIGLVMLFMVLLRLELGHFKGIRQFSMIAASWYWHFVDIVWIVLFITLYVVA